MQIFPREMNYLALVVGLVAAATVSAVVGVFWFYFSPKNLQVGYQPEQPVPYSHRLHAGELGMDCRYCHSQVERSHEAMVPPVQTCMGCHSLIHTESAKLAPIRESWETGTAMEWVRVHQIPDHVFFDHSIHVAVGVGCVSCHGRVDRMDEVKVEAPLSMGWCLDCHRDPAPNLRPPSEVTNMSWEPDQKWLATLHETAAGVNPPQNCSGCHR